MSGAVIASSAVAAGRRAQRRRDCDGAVQDDVGRVVHVPRHAPEAVVHGRSGARRLARNFCASATVWTTRPPRTTAVQSDAGRGAFCKKTYRRGVERQQDSDAGDERDLARRPREGHFAVLLQGLEQRQHGVAVVLLAVTQGLVHAVTLRP